MLDLSTAGTDEALALAFVAVTPRVIVPIFVIGCVIGLAVDETLNWRLSWWFVPACGLAATFVAHAARHRSSRHWQERNAALILAGAVVAASITQTWLVLAVATAALGAQYLAFVARDRARSQDELANGDGGDRRDERN